MSISLQGAVESDWVMVTCVYWTSGILHDMFARQSQVISENKCLPHRAIRRYSVKILLIANDNCFTDCGTRTPANETSSARAATA